MDTQATIIDPQAIQLRALEAITAEALQLEDLAKPAAVRLLVLRQTEMLTELRVRQAEVAALRAECDKLRQEREDLRVALVDTRAHTEERGKALLAEIPMSAFLGFAVNTLTDNLSDGVAWFMLIVSVAVLVILRLPGVWQKAGEKGVSHA